MAGMKVEEVKIGELDSAGNPILEVYAKVTCVYAVYRTETSVMVHFADKESLGIEQRLCLVSLQDIRGKINELASDILLRGENRGIKIVSDIRRQLAFALQIALQGQNDVALLRLARLHARLVDQKQSEARLYYLCSALIMPAIAIVIAWIALSPLFATNPESNKPLYLLWIAFAAGAGGAFFSSVVAIRDRTLRSASILRDNLIDGGLRIFVGSIAAVILVDLVYLEMVALKIGGLEFSNDIDWSHVLILGVFAGFFERLVPDMLNRLYGTMKTISDVVTPAGLSNLAGGPRDENSPYTGKGPSNPPTQSARGNDEEAETTADEESAEFDGCCDRPIDTDSGLPVTDDVELPPASGGVEEAVTPIPPKKET